MQNLKIYLIVVLGICFQFSTAQKKDDNIGTEVVNVVKPYTPTISDAYKVKETPNLEDAETSNKETIQYQIFSFPVASTFTPAKGKAAGVDKPKQEKLFSNYVTLGYGNYGTLLGEFFVSHPLDKEQYVGALVRHLSSQGGINNVILDDTFSTTSAAAMYGYTGEDMQFKLDLGYQREGYNWYGLPIKNPNFNNIALDTINPKHNYNTFKIGSEFGVTKSFLDKLYVNYIGFSDDYGSKENRFMIKPNLKFDFGDTAVKMNFNLDYANTSFASNYALTYPIVGNKYNLEFSNLIFSGNPSFTILKQDLSVEVGAEVTYHARLKNTFGGVDQGNNNGIYVYPKVKASYKLVGDLMVLVAGAEGGLQQNTYENFVVQNKFLSPTLSLAPTDNAYTIYGGIRGKLANSVAYNVKASYDASNNKALFKSNPYLSAPSQNYSYGNSISVVYDDLKIFSLYGELKADLNKNVSIGIDGRLNAYTTSVQAEAWNLPTVQVAFTTDFTIGSKFYAGAKLFYVGERKDEFTNVSGFVNPNSIQTLEGYFDINAHVGYKHNERLTVFLKGNNLANQNYQKWLNYPVQGAQGILGASYKFDF